MKTIWKYRLYYTTELEMPARARVVSVNIQDDEAYLWALVDTDEPLVKRRFRLFGTGGSIPDELWTRHVGTVHIHREQLVWHVFETT